MDYWRIIYKFAWALLIVIVPVGVTCMFVPHCGSLRALNEKRALLADENRRTEEATRELRLRQERFMSDPLFVERVAREAGMAKSNEVVFRVAADDPARLEVVTNAAVTLSNPPSRRTSTRATAAPRGAPTAPRRRTH